MRRIISRPWPVVCALLLAALVFSLTHQFFSHAGGSEPAAKGVGPGVYALVLISRQEPRLLDDKSHAAPDPAAVDEYRQRQVLLVCSQPVLRRALRDDKARNLAVIEKQKQKDPLGWLGRQVRAELLDNTGMMRVWVRDGTPQEQAILTNAVVHAYFTEVRNLEHGEKWARLQDMERSLAKTQDNVRKQRESLRRLADSMKTGDRGEFRQKLMLQEIEAVQKERLQVKAELRKLLLERAALENSARATIPEDEVDKAVNQDPQLIRLRDETARMETRLADMAGKIKGPEKEPSYQAAQARLKEAKKTLEAQRELLRSSVLAQLEKRHQAKERDARLRLDRKITLLEELLKELSRQSENEARELERLAVRSTELDLMQEEINQSSEALRSLRAQKERLAIEVATTIGPRVSILQEAEAP